MNEKVENVVAKPSTERFPSVPLENAFISSPSQHTSVWAKSPNVRP